MQKISIFVLKNGKKWQITYPDVLKLMNMKFQKNRKNTGNKGKIQKIKKLKI